MHAHEALPSKHNNKPNNNNIIFKISGTEEREPLVGHSLKSTYPTKCTRSLSYVYLVDYSSISLYLIYKTLSIIYL